MSNVNPGDFAKVIADPGLQGIMGMTVYVRRTAVPTQQEFKQYLNMSTLGHLWECEVLESRMMARSALGPSWLTPGKRIWVTDRVLQRIEPPSTEEDLWSMEPLPNEERKP